MKERQLTVVIADDTPEDRAALHSSLSRGPEARYMVIEVESGIRALELCRGGRPDCLILDLDLPDLSGLDVLITAMVRRDRQEYIKEPIRFTAMVRRESSP